MKKSRSMTAETILDGPRLRRATSSKGRTALRPVFDTLDATVIGGGICPRAAESADGEVMHSAAPPRRRRS